MRFEAWTLAVCDDSATGVRPYAEIHSTYAEALRSITRVYEAWLGYLSAEQFADEKAVAEALDGVVQFTIEPAIIETSALAEAE